MKILGVIGNEKRKAWVGEMLTRELHKQIFLYSFQNRNSSCIA